MVISTSTLVALEPRQQQQHVVTQTLTRQASTVVTVVTLGPAATPGDIRPEADIYAGQRGLSAAQLGAILGSVAAAVVIIVVVGICLTRRRRERVVVYYDHASSYGTPSVADSLARPQNPRYPPELIPGGAPYPTYRAVPIKNPRQPPGLRRVYV